MHSSIISTSSRIIQFTDEIVIGMLLTVSMVTPYSFAVTLVSHFERLVWAAVQVLVPALSKLTSEQKKDEASAMFLQASRLCNLGSLWLFTLCFLLGPSFIGVWLGKEYEEPCSLPLRILLVARTLQVMQGVTTAKLLGTSRHRTLSRINAAEAFANLTISLLLAKSMGLVGVALGTLIPSVIFNGIVGPVLNLRLLDVSIGPYIFRCVAPFVAIAGTCIALGQSLEPSLDSYPQLAFFGILISIAYAVASAALATTLSEKRSTIRLISQRIGIAS